MVNAQSRSGTQELLARLRIRHPIIQAPMAGVSTPRMAAEVSEAGGLGSLGLGTLSADDVAQQIRATRELTSAPFNVNFFCHPPAKADAAREANWLAHLAHEFRQFGAEPPKTLKEIYRTALDHDAALQTLLTERPAVASFHFGVPPAKWIEALRGAGIVTMACATSLDEAARLEQAGVDVLVAQGAEAGGHRGAFDPAHDLLLGTFPLVRMLVKECSLPVVAAGGIMDGAGIAAALQLGAAAVQMGTAFILCPESAASPAFRAELQGERARHTSITPAISGRPARGIWNRFHALDQGEAPPVPDYPIAYDAGKALHQAAARHGNHAYAAHWAGQGAPLAREMSARELMATLVEEWKASSSNV